ncbi:hypothetical protein DES49_1852 [Halospina denitrificans]|uniref:Uncharacterized protein n=1 Tax=Halospina denitrificans TaxID=332522 RepID=A0A4R7JTW9_9GAMM|nr:hypothetical protein [Halospina denitrificans]TDT41750.1 hypothetical protein DES49_1852 [Halospina denitrificans]
MSRIGIMLRGVLRWVGERLPRRIAGLLVPRQPERSAPLTMAESREQALAAWEQLVSEHAPHLMRESPRGRRGETPLHWPRMEPFASTRKRAWPTYPAGDYSAPLKQEQRQAERYGESGSPRAWPEGERTPGNTRYAHSGAGASPEPAEKHSVQSRCFGEQLGTTPGTSTPSMEPAPTTAHRGWQKPLTADSDSVSARHTNWCTESAGNRARSPDTAIPESAPPAHDWMTPPVPGAESAQRGYAPPMPEPPTTNWLATSTGVTTPAAGPQHPVSPWLETPVPEGNRPAFEAGNAEPGPQHSRRDAWPDLPSGPLSSPPEAPRAGWAEADRRQRLFDEQRGVL